LAAVSSRHRGSSWSSREATPALFANRSAQVTTGGGAMIVA